MKIVIPRQQMLGILRWSQRLLLAGAVSLFLYCGFVATDSWIFQRREHRRLEHLLTEHLLPGASQKHFPPSGEGSLIGRIDIPRLQLSVMVAQGTGTTTLRRAAGHILGTALPGEPGNIGVSGHRDTFFRPLRNIRENDIITMTTLKGEYRYRVVSTKIVAPSDVAVLAPSRKEILTLVTCYPFYFVGPAPSRFIVRAERTKLASTTIVPASPRS